MRATEGELEDIAEYQLVSKSHHIQSIKEQADSEHEREHIRCHYKKNQGHVGIEQESVSLVEVFSLLTRKAKPHRVTCGCLRDRASTIYMHTDIQKKRHAIMDYIPGAGLML